jgi:hypothetical protein
MIDDNQKRFIPHLAIKTELFHSAFVNQKRFIPHLAFETELFHSVFVNFLYDVKPTAQSEGCAPYCAFAH